MATDAITKIDLGLTRTEFDETQHAFLFLSTAKRPSRKAIQSDAYVWWVSDTGNQHAFGLASGKGDFELVLRSTPAARVTQKAIDLQH